MGRKVKILVFAMMITIMITQATTNDANCTVRTNKTKYITKTIKLKPKLIHIKKKKATVDIKYSPQVIYLARLIQSEGLDQPMDAKIGIGNVILNRHKQYSHNMRNVRKIVTSRGQFNGCNSRLFKKQPSTDCLKASYLAYKGVNTVGKSTHFLNLDLCKKNKTVPNWTKKFKFIKKIGDTSFYENKNF